MNVKSNESESARELGSAIRELRRAVGFTQAQLAVAIGIAPTSVYRYEAGMTKPDLRTVQKLFIFADQHQNEVAKKIFRGELEDDGTLVITGTEGSSLKMGIKDTGSSGDSFAVGKQALSPRERLLATAFVLMMRNNLDESSEKMMRLLLEPWMKAAKDEVDPKD
jgi:transcriptional regulator with XRE-family HTH domain